MSDTIPPVFSNAGCLLYFAEGCSEQERADTQDSILYTQLSACKSYHRFSQAREWAARQRDALHGFGWVMAHREAFSVPFTDLPEGSLHSAVHSNVPTFVSAQDSERLWAAASDCYRHDPAQPGWLSYAGHVFGPQARGGSKAVVQLGLLQPGAALTLTSITFNSRRSVLPGLPFDALSVHDVVGDITFAFHRWQLAERTYALSRGVIHEKLASRRESLIFSLRGPDDKGLEPQPEVTRS